jgi:hypothetical protein
MRSFFACFAVLMVAIAAGAGEGPATVRQNIRVISSAEAKGTVDAEKLQHCFWQLLEQQGLGDRESPRVLVLHVSKEEAAVAGVHDAIIRHESIEGAGTYYQVWLIDNFNPAHYVIAFQAIIRQAFASSITEAQENALLLRALRVENATISAREKLHAENE